MKTTQERFINLGGRFEVGIHYTHLIYNNYKMKIPNEYFLSTDVAHQEVLNYYIDMMPKIGEQSGVILPKEFGFEFIDPLTYCGKFDTRDCTSCEQLSEFAGGEMNYNIDNYKVFLGDKEITGYASGDFVSYPINRLWYKDIEGKPFNVYATCDDGHTFEISFTEDDYEKWITPMEPTEKSPFKLK